MRFLGVNFILQKLCQCKKNYNYKVWSSIPNNDMYFDSAFPKHHEDVLHYVSHFISRENPLLNKVRSYSSVWNCRLIHFFVHPLIYFNLKLDTKHELLVCWISVNFLWWNLNLRIRSLGTFTRHSNSKLNQSLPSPGDGGGQMSASTCPGWQHWQNRVSDHE